jgi:transglutaminase-like putative cysteine protease
MLIHVSHVTRYAYAEPVSYSVQSLRLTPAPFQGQRIVQWRVDVPGCGKPLEFRDGFGNTVQLVAVSAVHRELVVQASGTVETKDTNGVVQGLAKSIPPRVFLKETALTKADAAIRDLAKSVEGKDRLATTHALSSAIRDRIEYAKGHTGAHTSAAEALADGKGVCQDHAHVFIAAARTLGFPARYVTGYLLQEVDKPDTIEGEPGSAQNAPPSEAPHAWAEVWVEALGWVGFDVANRVCPTDRYVRLATGLDAGSAAPVVGSRRGGAGETLDVTVTVQQQQATQQQ